VVVAADHNDDVATRQSFAGLVLAIEAWRVVVALSLDPHLSLESQELSPPQIVTAALVEAAVMEHPILWILPSLSYRRDFCCCYRRYGLPQVERRTTRSQCLAKRRTELIDNLSNGCCMLLTRYIPLGMGLPLSKLRPIFDSFVGSQARQSWRADLCWSLPLLKGLSTVHGAVGLVKNYSLALRRPC